MLPAVCGCTWLPWLQKLWLPPSKAQQLCLDLLHTISSTQQDRSMLNKTLRNLNTLTHSKSIFYKAHMRALAAHNMPLSRHAPQTPPIMPHVHMRPAYMQAPSCVCL